MRQHAIRRTDNILLYDKNGFFSVCRVALMFRYFGAEKVRIINGGLKKWLAEHRPTHSGPYVPGEGLDHSGDYNYHVTQEDIFVRKISEVHQAAHEIFNGSHDIQILDARPNVLTYGGEPGRPGFLSGNITGSKSFFAQNLINQNDGTFKGEDEIQEMLREIHVNAHTKTINSCGSGITACIVDMALRLQGSTNTHVYDGSWAEYKNVPEPDFVRQLDAAEAQDAKRAI